MKKIIIKLVILLAIFIGTIALYFVTAFRGKAGEEEIMKTASLPIVSMMYNGEVVNTLHGYTLNMDSKYMRDSITPLEDGKKTEISINTYGNVIAGVSYELRSLDAKRLIENTAVDNYEVRSNRTVATFNFSKIMEKESEYILIIKLVTEKHGEINYYTRVIEQEEINIDKHIGFIKGFSKSTLDKEAAKEYLPYLEPKASADNTNLANVNLNSSFSNVTWRDLEVSRVTEPIVCIKELLGDVGCYELKYKVKVKRTSGENVFYEYYNISEFFRIRQGVNVMYLYVYERNMEQIFDCNTQTVSSTRVNLGLDSDLNVETSSSPTGSYVAFVKERNLWIMEMSSNQMTCIMSFESGSDSDVRDIFDENDIEIVSTDSNGNVLFLVYGYMNKGEHEGEVGTALYQYKNYDNEVNELVFISSNKPFEIEKGQIGKFAYITKDNIIYMMVDNGIYTVTMDSNEYVQLTGNLQSGNFITNGNNNIVAWHENGSVYEADCIRVIDVAKAKDYKIKADKGDYLKVIGFVGNDLIYGICHKSDIHENGSGDTVFPMYKLMINIYEKDKPEIYQKDGIYVIAVEAMDNMMNLKRIKKSEGGNWSSTTDDQIINKTDATKAQIELSTISTDLKQTELVLKFAYTITCDDELSKKNPESINFVAVNDIGKDDDDELIDKNYYVYGNGNLIMRTEYLKDAINKASSEYGVVVDGDGNYVWARLSKLDNKVVSSATDAASPNYRTIREVLEDEELNTLDVSGLDIEDVLYYTTKGIPVLTKLNEYGVVAISGYSGYLGNVDTVYFRTYDGTSFNMSINMAKRAIAEAGERYVVIMN